MIILLLEEQASPQTFPLPTLEDLKNRTHTMTEGDRKHSPLDPVIDCGC